MGDVRKEAIVPPAGPVRPERWTLGTDGRRDAANPLKERIRAESEQFRFNALIDGVSTLDREPVSRPAVVATPSPQRQFQWASLALALLVISGGLVLFLVRAVAPNEDPPLPAAIPDNRDLTPSERMGLPNPEITPGERAIGMRNREVIDPRVRREVFALYGRDSADPHLVLARVVPLELDGTSGRKNLFPTTRWFADLKARLDKRIAEEVRMERLTYEKAREMLAENWIRVAHTYRIRNFGETNPSESAVMRENAMRWQTATPLSFGG